ncbi:MAG: hypothetical protein QMD09_14840, partial [Desulfatibacillaceae bacterium]|nr:hypothetical protein [Desulfatibacillaceae bacterium]
AKIGKENLVKESLQDLNLVANAAYDVLCTTGFGAKTSSIGARAQSQLPPGKKAEILFFTGADRAGNAISPKKLEGDKLENVLSSILEYGEKLQEGLTAPPNRREDKAL